MKRLYVMALAIAMLGLQGCALMKAPKFVPANPEQMTEWSVEGSMKVNAPSGDHKTYFEYREINGEYRLAVRPDSPVQENQAEVKGVDGEGKSSEKITAKNPDAEALAKSLQAVLPLNDMSYWLRALPATDGAELKRDSDQNLDEIKDDGWKIQYDDYMQVNDYRLPDAITMKTKDTKVSINLVRAETGFLTSPCPAGAKYDSDVDPATMKYDSSPASRHVVEQLVPPSGAAPAPRWIDDHDFCKQLYKVHGKIPDPRVGLYGPDSMMWKIVGPLIPAGMGAGRALLLQVAHPWVTAGIDQHSIVRHDPLERARRTFIYISTIVYGSMPQVMNAAYKVHQIHKQITGTIPYNAGAFPEGTKYGANEESAMIWVQATLWDTLVKMYEQTEGPLTHDEKERFYQETKLFAMLFGIREKDLPPDWDSFQDYVQSMFYSPQLTVTDHTRQLEHDLFDNQSWILSFPLWIQKIVTAANLPPRIREGYGLPYDDWEKFNYVWIMGLTRFAAWIVPDTIGINAVQHEAEARLKGERVGPYQRMLIKAVGTERLVN